MSPKAAAVAALFVFLAVAASLAADDEVRIAGQDLSVRIEPGEHEIEGEAILYLESAAPAPRTLTFQIHSGLTLRLMSLRSGGAWRAASSQEEVPGESDGWWREALIPVPAGTDAVKVRYRGKIYDAVERAADLDFVVGDDTRGVIGEEGVFLVASSGWYPATSGTTVFRSVTIDVPANLRAVTQGRLAEREVREGRERTRWESETPVDGLAMQVGAYVVDSREVLGVKLSTYLFAEDRPHAKLFLDSAEKYIRFYTPILGPYPWPKFDIVENFFTTGYGMPSFTLLGNDVMQVMVMMAARYGGDIPPGYIDHEMVHCWWGNFVYPDYETGNWCEGLTSYYSNYLRKEDEDPKAAREHRKKISTTFSIRVTEENDYPVRKFGGKKEDFENDIGYGKASMVFHALRSRVGSDVFFETMRRVVRKHGGKRTSWKDFEAAFSKASGEDLGWFFDQWLDRKGAPVLSAGEFGVERTEGGMYIVRGEILQEGEPYRLTVPVSVRHADGVSAVTVAVDGPKTVFTVPVPRTPLAVSIDPGFQVFRHVPLDEIQPCLNLTLARPGKVFVVPEGDEAYAKLAGMAASGKGGQVLVADGSLPKSDCVLFGRPEANPAVAKVLAAAGVKIVGNAVTIKGKKHEGENLWLLLSTRHPEVEGKFVTVFFGMTPKALGRARVIFHYGWDGYLVYAGRRPLARGEFTRIVPRTEKALRLALGERKVKNVLESLTDPKLGGRLAGTAGDMVTRLRLVAELRNAGAEEVREVPFSFTVRDFTDTEALSVDDVVKPGAIVPAVFSAAAPDGVGIWRVVRYGERVDAGDLVLLPDEQNAEALMLLLATLAGSDAAAVAIPASVLSSKDRRMADLAAFPGQLGDAKGNAWLAASGRQARALRPAAPLSMPVVFLDMKKAGIGVGETRARLRVRFSDKVVKTASIVGTIPDSSGRLTGRAIGLSAHFDGLGEGHEGADDNASGVAAVLSATRLLSVRRDLLGKPVRVLLFGAEEWGLRGSAALVDTMADDLVSLINLDTVGAADVADVFLIGRSHHPHLSAPAAECLEMEGLAMGRDIDRFAFAHGSDHWSFHAAGVPALDLFSGAYRRMNSAADTLSLVDPEKVARIGRATARLVLELASRPEGD